MTLAAPVIADPSLNIGVRQNEESSLHLLKARQWRWAVAVRWQISQLVLVLMAPGLALSLGLFVPDSKPWISFMAVCLTLADVTWIDRAYKNSLKTAARASELFDCHLLKMDWNAVVTGKQPTPEETERASRGWDQLGKKGDIKDWYSPVVDKVSSSLARVICQRTNLTYDSDLRRLYKTILDLTILLVAIALLAIGVFGKQLFSDFVLTTWVPTAPFLIWTLRERFRQSDVVQSNEPVIAEAEKLISSVISGACDDEVCRSRSRLLQDALFYRRATTVLLFPGIYRFRRKSAERDMRAGAKYWVEKAGK